MAQIETGTTLNNNPHSLAEAPLYERYSAFNERARSLERAQERLIVDGEKALRDGIRKLSETEGLESTQDRVFTLRQPLTLPPYGQYTYSLPDQLSRLVTDLQLWSRKDLLSTEPVDFWAELPYQSSRGIRLAANSNGQKFGLTMQYNSLDYYLDRRDTIVTFRGFSTERFEFDIDSIKDVNRADSKTQLSVALGMIKLVYDLSSPRS